MSALKTSKGEHIDTSKHKNTLSRQTSTIAQIIGDLIVVIIKVTVVIIEALYRVIVPLQEKSVRGEIVLVTGAGHGIGKELALQYASQGATVICWDINKANNDETAREISKLGYPKAHTYTCDVTDSEQVKELASKVEKEVGDVTILINNAGILYARTLLDHSKQEILQMMNVNVMAHFWVLQAFLPAMLKRNYGHIVALSSMAGVRGFTNLVPYCTSKYAVRGMMEALYQEVHTDPNCNLKFTTIFPYIVDTGLCKNPVIRFPKLFPMVKPKQAAAHIMSAQRRDIFRTSIPGHLLILNLIMDMLPLRCVKLIYDFTGVSLDADFN